MTDKNRAHLELQTRVSRQRNSQIFVSDGSANVVARPCRQTSLDWQMATPTTKESVCRSVGEETLQLCKVNFSHSLTRDHAADIPFRLRARHSGKKSVFAKESVLMCLLCLVHCALCLGLLPKQLTKINAPGCFRATLWLNARCTAGPVSWFAKPQAHQHIRCGVGCGGSHFQSQ